MRRNRSRRQLPQGWESVAARVLGHWSTLDEAQRARLAYVARLVMSKRWEASHGFAIDDTMRVTVAVHAALLSVGHRDKPFGNVTAVVIHPATIMLRGERPGPMPGTRTDAPLAAHGHTSARGPVYIAWDAVEREQASARRSTNVILHEFAHKIDALNGTFDGTPPLADREQLREWVEVCTAELAALRRGQADWPLRSYGATNPSEFFAVATEAFFSQPVALRARKPRLYGVLARFYGQDPAPRQQPDSRLAKIPPAPGRSHITTTGWAG